MVVNFCYRITYGDDIFQVREASFFNSSPEALHPRPVVELRHTTEVLVTVVNQSFSFDFTDEKIGIKRIQIVGYQRVAAVKQQEEEQPEVQFCIEKKSFFEEQSEPAGSVAARRQGRGVGKFSSHQQNAKSHVNQ